MGRDRRPSDTAEFIVTPERHDIQVLDRDQEVDDSFGRHTIDFRRPMSSTECTIQR